MMKTSNFWLLGIMTLGLVLRLSVSLLGYHGDLNNNISWGTIAYEKGLNGFYGSDDANDWPYSAPNQPPLTILTFTLARFFWQKLHDFIWYMNWELVIFPSRMVWFWDDHGMTLLVKLPSIFADLGLGFLIYKFVLERLKKPEKIAIIAAAVWIFNPITWYNSGVWGQTDAVVNFLGLLAIFSLIEKNLTKFSVLFTLSFLFKGSLGTFIPVLFFFVLFQKYSVQTWFKAAICSLLVIIITSVWFHPSFDLPIWLYNLYTTRILPGEIGYLSANAFNFWWLVDAGKTYDYVKYFGLSARILGIIFTLLANGLVIYWLSRKPNAKRLLGSLLVVSLVSFLFMTRIHERYLYPFFPISTIYSALNPSYFLIYGLYSLIHLLNLYNLFWVPGIIWLQNLLTIDWVTNLFAITSVLLFIQTLRHLRRANI